MMPRKTMGMLVPARALSRAKASGGAVENSATLMAERSGSLPIADTMPGLFAITASIAAFSSSSEYGAGLKVTGAGWRAARLRSPAGTVPFQ